LKQLDIIAEFEIDKEALEKIAESNVEYECSTSGGASKRGALGPFGLYVLADSGLSEYTPVYFYVVKGSNGKLKTSFCSDQSRYLFNQIHLIIIFIFFAYTPSGPFLKETDHFSRFIDLKR
jgi:hypothetical protein